MILEDMPEEYYGKIKKGCGYTNTNPRDWTENEIKWILEKKKEGFTNKQIADKIGRTETSLSIKLKRLSKKENTYNKRHIQEKKDINCHFLNYIKPKTILDLYAGSKVYDKNIIATKNDINKELDTEYHEDAFKLICKLYSEDKNYDLIDLDPYGSAYDCFDLAIKMAKKGLIITLDDINNMYDFDMQHLIDYIIKIGKRNKKQLKVYDAKEWQNIGRVWFIIQPLKITKQWDK